MGSGKAWGKEGACVMGAGDGLGQNQIETASIPIKKESHNKDEQ